MEPSLSNFYNPTTKLLKSPPHIPASITSSGLVTIQMDIDRELLYVYQIHNQLGQLIAQESILLSAFGNTLDLSSLPAGSYYLSVFAGDMQKMITKRILLY